MAEDQHYISSGAQAVKGMNLMSDPLQQEPGDVSFARDFIIDMLYNSLPFYSFARSNKIYASLPKGFHFLGSCNMRNKARCIFGINADGVSEVGVLTKKLYTPNQTNIAFNFKADKPIQAVSKVDIKGEEHVYWVDNHNNIRHLNLSNPPLINGLLNMEAINVFRNFTVPDIKIADIVPNGVLPSGSYYVTAQYADANGNGLTGMFTPVGPIPIYKDNLNQPFEYVSGSEPDEPTGKSIKIALSKVDASYDYLNICIVRSINGVRRIAIVGTIPTNQTEYIYTGATNSEIEITEAELLVQPVVYKTAKTIAEVNGQLIIGNLKRRQDFNLQPYINNLQVQWQNYWTKGTSPKTSYKNPLYSVYKKSYRRGESYALGIVFIYKDGSKSPVYFIPGRKKNTFSGNNVPPSVDQFGNSIQMVVWDDQLVTNTGDDYVSDGGQTPQRWQLYNTAFKVGSDLSPSLEGPGEYGEMGYYESTEKFPNNPAVWGAFAGQPILLHRMPDSTITHIHDGDNESRTSEAETRLKLLGLRFPNLEIVLDSLPAEVKADIQGWEIVRADRKFSKTIIANGLVHNAWQQNWKSNQNDNDDLRIYPNSPFNDLRPDYYTVRGMDEQGFYDTGLGYHIPGEDGGLSQLFNATSRAKLHHRYLKDTFTFYSPDTMFERSFLSASEMVINTEEYGKAEMRFSYLKPYPELQETKNNEGDENVGEPRNGHWDKFLVQLTGYGYYNNYVNVKQTQHVRRLKEAIYVPFNAQVSGGGIGHRIHNLMRESSVFVGLDKPINDPAHIDTSRAITSPYEFRTGVFAVPDSEQFNVRIEEENKFRTLPRKRTISAFYVSLRNQIPNQYGSISDMHWVPTGFNHHNTTRQTIVFGGDTFITLHSFKKQNTMYRNLQEYMYQPFGPHADLRYTNTVQPSRFFYDYIGDRIYVVTMNSGTGEDGSGYIPAIISGIPCFWCESDINTDLRLPGKVDADAYFPNLADGSIEIENFAGVINANKDNVFAHNKGFSEQNDLASYRIQSPLYNPLSDTQEHLYNRVIWSMKQVNDSYLDYWITFKPNNKYDFPTNRGELWDIRYIGQQSTMYRFQRSFFIESTSAKMETSDQEIQLGSGSLFERDPIERITTDNGYAGTMSQWAFNSTPFGHFMADAENGSVFQFQQGLQDITMNNAGGWFKENLPFKLLKQLPDFPYIDNPTNPNGIGLSSGFDDDNKLWYLTKIDYELINESDAGRITYRDGNIYYDNIAVSLQDENLFANRSFTIGYSPLRKKWISYYSFIAGAYFTMDGKLLSVPADKNDISFYEHNIPNQFRTFYGKVYNPIIEFVHKANVNGSVYTSWNSFNTRCFTYQGAIPIENDKLTFSSGVFYNNHQSTGKVTLHATDNENLADIAASWFDLENNATINIERTHERWFFNEIYDYSIPGRALFTDKWSVIKDEFPIDKVVNPEAFSGVRKSQDAIRLRDDWVKTRYYFEHSETNVNLFVQLSQVVHQQAIR